MGGKTQTGAGERSELTLDLVVRGDTPDEPLVSYARRKVLVALRTAPAPVRSCRLTLAMEPHRSIERPASVEVLLDLDGRGVFAHATARSPREAVDLLEVRLRRRLERVRAEQESARRRRRREPRR